ncbi:MAG: hypothetical protein WBJ28_00265 [Bacilli bacterium]|jgi:hypothetical protein|nr:hypothetical protein [Bacillota bacterium]NLI52337.1 hypothetical protein [Erysipelotrichaceae bacterium]HOA11564.1 hypothetical protein [Bacilli bacterium]TAH58955.1 MAG: hypothetical protein EWM49_02375 [Bacillota bacterium]HOQ70801.1 hypothetical protein [Bacilli bacterium]
MVVISLLSLVVSFLVFMGVRFAVYSLNPSNYLFADILIIIIGSFIVSLIFAIRQFRYMGRDKWRSQFFHSFVLRTFLINFAIIFIISLLWSW